ncbi:hypothetical protein [Psychrobacter sp. I-STPA6b]|uniref:hypothetical protein n=1 Tax=Psychrobacter sp. I-STPA6b TaxID=2585718 RepID=UPI001D0CB470|nr:hypothetical protein [Psychrobacter sp. I-STPA6b]
MQDLRAIFNPDVIKTFQVKQPLEKAKFWQSGAFTSDTTLRPLLTSGSKTFQVPYINPIDADLEANYSNTIFTDIAMPREISAGATSGRAAYLNEGFLESSLQRFLLQKSPLQLMAGMIDDYWAKQADNRAIATLIGLRNYDQGQSGKPLTTDISKATADAGSGFDVNAFIDAEGTLDEAYQGGGLMIVHPLIATKMRKQQLIEKLATTDNLPPVETYNGRQIITSKRATMIGKGANAKFVTYLLGRGAFAADMVRGNNDLELERTAATGNGSGHTTMWTRRNMLIHPQGFSFIAKDNQLTGGTKNEALSASWEDLTNKDYWQLDEIPERVAIRFLITNL